MSAARVVVTGIGLVSPIGASLHAVSQALQAGRHGIRIMPEWDAIDGLATRLGAVVDPEPDWSQYSRKQTRSMGRVSLLAAQATRDALADSGLEPELLGSGEVGLAYGSTSGSPPAMQEFCTPLFRSQSVRGVTSTTYLKFMSHTCAANLALFFGIRGRVLTTCSACTSSSQAVGHGYETIKHGLQPVMICGGAEEMHVSNAAVFDIMYAASSHFNTRPEASPRPFDVARDGLVVGEGAGTLVLEEYERARARGAHIHAEIIGFGTNCDGQHVTSPSVEGMASVMRLSLRDAGLEPAAIQYINAHATATEAGDIAESQAVGRVLGTHIPISSTKGNVGHTLGACGAIELAFCVAMMNDGFLAPNRNLLEVDPRCAPLDYVRGEPRPAPGLHTVMSNNFAFGGINTSLILRRL